MPKKLPRVSLKPKEDFKRKEVSMTERAIDTLTKEQKDKVLEGRRTPLEPKTPEQSLKRQQDALKRIGGIPAATLRLAITTGL